MRRSLMGLTAAALAAALPAMVQAAFAWNLGVSPTTVTQGQSTTFSLTATNQQTQSQLGCIQVDLPTSFVIVSIGTPTASDGEPWVSRVIVSGNSVEVKSAPGPGRLENGESVTFTVTARPTAAGTFLWNNHAFASNNCNGTMLIGTPASITVVPAPTPNPTPTLPPNPKPTSNPTSTPTTSRPPASTPTSGASPPPGAETPSPRPGEPSSTSDTSGSASPSSPVPGAPPDGTSTGGGDRLQVAPLNDSAGAANDDLGTGLDVLALLDGPFVWFVPGAAVGVPGLLVIVFVALQAIGALAWIPAMRRMEGDDRRRRRSRPA